MIWSFCIRRPVLTVVLFLALAIFGAIGYTSVPVRENPDVEFPIVSVNVVLPGAEPEVIETEVIEPLESEINTIEGLKQLQSTARAQVGTVIAEFQLYRDIDVAAQDVRAAVDRARRDLPEEVEAPIVQKLDPDAQAIMWLTLTGDERWDPVRMTDYADNQLKERLESLPGVGKILIGGERRYAVRIMLDPERLAAHDLTVQDVVRAIQANNVDIPSGRVEGEQREFLVKTQGQLSSAAPFNDLVLAHAGGDPVRLADVGEAVDGVENDRQLARFAGEPTVGLGVVKQTDANTVALAESVKAKIETLAEEFPPGLEYHLATDDSRFVRQSIDDLLITIGLATLLVILVVFLFLHTGWGTFITSLAIPCSLLGGFALMFLFGFSINTLTMLSLILVTGIVIDDAVVVLESCYRQVEQGVDAEPAARVGTTEVAFAAIANSLSLAAVFIPVAFTEGLIGRFFYQFGITVAGTVFLSTFTALTLTPMLCSRLLKKPGKKRRLARWIDHGLDRAEAAYDRVLQAGLRHRLLTLAAAFLAFGLGVFFFTRLSTEFIPTVDRSEMMIAFQTPEGATLDETNQLAKDIEDVLRETEVVDHWFLAVALARQGPGKVNEGVAFVHLVPRGERDQHQSALMQQMREKLRKLPGGLAFVTEAGGGPQSQSPVEIVLQEGDMPRLAKAKERMLSWMRKNDAFVGVDSNLELNKPEVDVRILRDQAQRLGISVADISNALRYLLGEPDISEVERGTERYEVITEIRSRGEMVPDDLESIFVRSDAGALVPLGTLVRLEEDLGPAEIHHFNRRRSATLSASTPPGTALGDAISSAERWMAENLDGIDHALSGQAQDFQESFANLSAALAFSLVFVYLVLAAQFESFVLPFVILVSIPLASAGAFGALWAFGMSFNIYTFIGMIMLLGMATKNAILMVDYTNVLRRRGLDLEEAAAEAAKTRFRPVIMTTISTVLGLLPIALGFGAGGRARAPLGVAVGAGLLATTVLTLVVLPAFYVLVAGGIDRVKARRAAKKAERAEASS